MSRVERQLRSEIIKAEDNLIEILPRIAVMMAENEALKKKCKIYEEIIEMQRKSVAVTS